MPLTFTSVDDLVTLIRAVEVRADVDPSRLNLPGAWVTVERIVPENLAGTLRLEGAVYLIVRDADHRRAMEALAELHTAVVPGVFRPDGPVVPQGVLLPSDPTTPLPALRLPIYLYE